METILITGGTGLIGRAQVNYFLNKYRIVLIYRNEKKLKEFNYHPNLIPLKIDNLLKNTIVDEIIAELDRKKIYPEYLINMASDPALLQVDDDGFASRKNMINLYIINVVLPYELSFKLANHSKTHLKKIINISSMYGIVPYNPTLYENPKIETFPQYSLSKAAMIHLTKELAIRFKDKNILVNTISYGGIDNGVDERFKRKFSKITPLKRMMKPEETISAVEFLIEDKSNYITGQNIVVDGGRTVW